MAIGWSLNIAWYPNIGTKRQHSIFSGTTSATAPLANKVVIQKYLGYSRVTLQRRQIGLPYRSDTGQEHADVGAGGLR